jgi:hypothetical protein
LDPAHRRQYHRYRLRYASHYPGSGHMRRRGSRADSVEILGWGSAVEGVVRPVMIEAMGEGVDEGLQLVDAVGQVVGGVELISPGAVAAFDGAVELRALGRQHVEGEALFLAGALEVGHELGTAVDLDGFDLERHVGDELVEEGAGEVGGCAAGDPGDGPFGDRIISGEVLDRLVGADVEEERVDLQISPGWLGFSPFGSRLAWRLPIRRKQRPPGCLRRAGTGVTTPLCMRWARMRPTVETETAKPSARKSTTSLRLPHMGLSARKSSTAWTSAEDHVGLRGRCGRRLFGAGVFSQR